VVSEDQEFVPTGFEPPTQFAIGAFRLEPLGAEHNERDYAAWTSSIQHIRAQPGFAGRNWPHEMTLTENLGDLERHAQDFAECKGFTYTVLDSTDDVVGCLYIYPVDDGVHDTKVRSWLRESEAAHEDVFRQTVAEWLTSDAWPFKHPLYEPHLG
jgi:hypothetical protein